MMKRSKLSHKFCPHCKKECNIKTYRDHKRLHYSQVENTWYGSTAVEDSSDSLDSFSDGHDEDDQESDSSDIMCPQ